MILLPCLSAISPQPERVVIGRSRQERHMKIASSVIVSLPAVEVEYSLRSIIIVVPWFKFCPIKSVMVDYRSYHPLVQHYLFQLIFSSSIVAPSGREGSDRAWRGGMLARPYGHKGHMHSQVEEWHRTLEHQGWRSAGENAITVGTQYNYYCEREEVYAIPQ